MTKTYITTAIDYPNARPHVGTAFEKIGADVQARFQRFTRRDVFFLMGNDEHTAKVVKRARELYSTNSDDIYTYVNKMADEFKAVWQALDISYDDFIQTSEDRHTAGVHKFLNAVNKAGYIYKKHYEGWYCEGCEEFKLEKNLTDKKCPNHNTPVVWREEENYFFKLSAFKQRLIDLYNKTDFQIVPASRLHEIANFVDKDLEDISISRVCTISNSGWGIPFPWDNTQVVYVWFDALLNYLTGVGFGTDDAKFKQWWPADIHFVGKDITRFHCALWPAMIMAYNEGADEPIALPKKVFGHGFVCTPAGKIGKSTGGIDPMELVNKYGSDAYRYYFLSRCDYASDSEYSVENFHAVYNGELANVLGNFVSRVANMLLQYSAGKVHNFGEPHNWKFSTEGWMAATLDCNYRRALELVRDILYQADKYIDDCKPWALNKQGDTALCCLVLRNLVAALRLVAVLLKPYLPKAAERIYNSFTFKHPWEKVDIYHLGSLNADLYIDLEGVALKPEVLVDGKFPPLFPRIKEDA